MGCKDNKVVSGNWWAMGEEFNFPERNCCSCGKGEEEEAIERAKDTPGCKDTPWWRSPKGYSCTGYHSYESKGWCEDGRFTSTMFWTGGEEFNFPEKNCCIC